jgi:hypothetical protein
MTRYEQRMFFERLVAMRTAYRAVEHGSGTIPLDDAIADAECQMIHAEEFEAAARREVEQATKE